MEEGWQLVVRFIDQSPSFANGFQLGEIYQQMKDGITPFECIIVSDNARMLQRLADHCSYVMTATALSEDWDSVRLERTRENPVKRRLSLVEPPSAGVAP